MKQRADQYELLCERCGYPIGGVAGESACPECGTPVAESLPERRVGSAWQRKPGYRTLVATAWATIRHPVRTFDTARIDRRSGRSMAGAHIWLAAQVFGALWSMLIITGWLLNPIMFREAILTVVINSLLWIPALLLVHAATRVEVGGIRFWGNRRGARVTPAVAWTVCGHAAVGWLLAGVLTPLGFAFSGVIVLISWHSDWDPGDWWVWPGPFVGPIVGLLIFETLSYVGVRRCRFANAPRPAPFAVAEETATPPAGGEPAGDAELQSGHVDVPPPANPPDRDR